jgi:hypothetical protein
MEAKLAVEECEICGREEQKAAREGKKLRAEG